jgi:HD-GYP domain-containing protein (c-di-GMP phosphodiesterase class II)
MLTLGSLLHDFDHFHNGLNIARPVSQFTKEEMEIFKKHPSEGGRRVQDKKHFDTPVINIIVQHEEMINGSGFPQGLKENKIDPLALICGTSNALDRLMTFEAIERKEAMKNLMINGLGKYPLSHLQGLAAIINNMKI